MKRARYTVRYLDGREPTVHLCYTPQWCWDYLDGVASVTKGDYRALPKRPSGARPHWPNIREAIDFLGLKLPVEIELNTRAQFQRGLHRTEPEHPALMRKGSKLFGTKRVPASEARWVHRITVHAALPADEMGRTIWHELTHGLQFERDVPLAGSVWDVLTTSHDQYRDGTTYKAKPAEVEANAMMEHNDELPLAR
jgi:hypothetical protein